MIFITLGTQKFQFNRLLKKIDELIENKVINEEVFAQIGYSDYVPKNFKYLQFINRNEFKSYIEKCDVMITHGGTGAIIAGVKANKKVIAVPRLEKYGEHVDDHQLQIVKQFKECNIIDTVEDMEELRHKIENIDCCKFERYISNTQKILVDIENFIEN